MANLLAKSKKYILCFLAAVALIFGVTGTAMLSDGRSVSAAETGHWMSHNGSGNTIQNGLTKYTAAAILANDQNILEMENNTVYFQMMVDKGSVWSGVFVFERLRVGCQRLEGRGVARGECRR